MKNIDLSTNKSVFSLKNKLARNVWSLTFHLAFRPFSANMFIGYRNFILKIFGAKIGKGSIVHSTVNIWAPWNLSIGNYSCLGHSVDCYNQGIITIGSNVTISQKTYLCASSHDISDSKHILTIKPIIIKDQVWIAADAFIGPGVLINEGAVIAARSVVFKNVEPWSVVTGNPAYFLKKRIIVK